VTMETVGRAHIAAPEIRAFLAGYDAQVRSVTLYLRELVLGMVPDAVEQLDLPARMLAYGFARTKDTICVIMPLKAAVNLGFPRGADLPDPTRLLAGTGRRARHVKIASIDQAQAPELRALLQASLSQLKSPL